MTYDEFITKPYMIWRKILHKSDEVVKIETVCTKATSVLGERVNSSPMNSQERNYVVLSETKKELSRLLDEYAVARDEVVAFLYGNLEHEEADLLEWKYIGAKTVKEMAELMSEQEQTIRNKMSRYEKKARSAYMKV